MRPPPPTPPRGADITLSNTSHSSLQRCSSYTWKSCGQSKTKLQSVIRTLNSWKLLFKRLVEKSPVLLMDKCCLLLTQKIKNAALLRIGFVLHMLFVNSTCRNVISSPFKTLNSLFSLFTWLVSSFRHVSLGACVRRV